MTVQNNRLQIRKELKFHNQTDYKSIIFEYFKSNDVLILTGYGGAMKCAIDIANIFVREWNEDSRIELESRVYESKHPTYENKYTSGIEIILRKKSR